MRVDPEGSVGWQLLSALKMFTFPECEGAPQRCKSPSSPRTTSSSALMGFFFFFPVPAWPPGPRWHNKGPVRLCRTGPDPPRFPLWASRKHLTGLIVELFRPCSRDASSEGPAKFHLRFLLGEQTAGRWAARGQMEEPSDVRSHRLPPEDKNGGKKWNAGTFYCT